MMQKSKGDVYNDSDYQIGFEMDRLWRPVFEKYDTEGHGKISVREFQRKIKAANDQLEEDIPHEVLDEIIDRAEWDQDGYIDYNEFLRMVNAREMGVQKPRLHRLIRFAVIVAVPKSQRRSVIRRYLEESNCSPPPFFLFSASIIQISFFIYYAITMNSNGLTGTVPVDSVLIYDPSKRQEFWRFLTYSLLHAGIAHLLGNILVQLMLGIPLEMVHKWWRVGLVYLSGVLMGSFGSSLSDPNSYLVGASGGVYALILAHLANVVLNYKEMEFRHYRVLAWVVYATTDIGSSIYRRYFLNEKIPVSYSAHLMGGMGGFLVGVLVLRNLKVREWERIFGIICLVLYCLLLSFCILWNVFNDSYFPQAKYSRIP